MMITELAVATRSGAFPVGFPPVQFRPTTCKKVTGARLRTTIWRVGKHGSDDTGYCSLENKTRGMLHYNLECTYSPNSHFADFEVLLVSVFINCRYKHSETKLITLEISHFAETFIIFLEFQSNRPETFISIISYRTLYHSPFLPISSRLELWS